MENLRGCPYIGVFLRRNLEDVKRLENFIKKYLVD